MKINLFLHCNFCAKYIRDFATLAEPLRKLTRKEVKCQWNSEQQIAFETLKQRSRVTFAIPIVAFYRVPLGFCEYDNIVSIVSTVG
jgi:hypothetical protein